MRLFLAIELSTPLLDALESAIAPLRAEAPDVAWVPPGKRHLTLKFLGDVLDDRLPRVVTMADSVARQYHPFAMRLSGIGAFPNFRRARVVWIGVEHEPRLELLHHDLEVAGEVESFDIEGRAFRPHITLARVRTPLEPDRVKRLARVARRIDFTATSDVSAITVFESTLASPGASYRRLHAAQLGGR